MPSIHRILAGMMKAQPDVGGVHVGGGLTGGNRPRSAFVARMTGANSVKPASSPGVRALCPMGKEGMAEIPFHFDPTALSKLRQDQMPRFLGALTNSDALPVATVPIDGLTAIQNRVDPAKATAWATGSIQSDRLPVVTKFAGKSYIADGHHRLAGAWLRGDKTAQVRLKDLDPVTDAMKAAGTARNWHLPIAITKADPDQQLIFGWASVVEKNGVIIIDKQGDAIPEWALEPAAYDFVLESRQHGDMHRNVGTGRLVESCVFTHEKQKALGIDLGLVGWWTGFKVDSPELWAAHKRGDRPEFSIGGKAVSIPIP